MFSSTQASRYICGNNLFSGLQNLGEGGRQCVFPELSLDLVSNQNSVLCHLFPTHLSWPLLVLVLREGDTKVIMLWGLEFCPSCCNTVTNGNTRLLWISFSLPVAHSCPLFIEKWGWERSRVEVENTTGQMLDFEWFGSLFKIANRWIAECSLTKGKIFLFHPSIFVFRPQCPEFLGQCCCKSTTANSQFNYTLITIVNVQLSFPALLQMLPVKCIL